MKDIQETLESTDVHVHSTCCEEDLKPTWSLWESCKEEATTDNETRRDGTIVCECPSGDTLESWRKFFEQRSRKFNCLGHHERRCKLLTKRT